MSGPKLSNKIFAREDNNESNKYCKNYEPKAANKTQNNRFEITMSGPKFSNKIFAREDNNESNKYCKNYEPKAANKTQNNRSAI